ncbi:hypothetical protein BAUCODRAFT_21330 [Baudoinia panamericana UAMH 10762]|uniref:Uncharacterized protein n=1 Tax=Baudoinia panamericana (strain UAMH 10762) TaxID=717646 RepID=M2NJI2_BAUPA|nr:uncharacterized protein BAUCODRAFT_21330 [Baudoinia panamericana UAMH 10762]EMC99549.1 hypothetical protein BAUCODRAFT_21330 [Baudoinia panamericana UAMH 10762]
MHVPTADLVPTLPVVRGSSSLIVVKPDLLRLRPATRGLDAATDATTEQHAVMSWILLHGRPPTFAGKVRLQREIQYPPYSCMLLRGHTLFAEYDDRKTRADIYTDLPILSHRPMQRLALDFEKESSVSVSSTYRRPYGNQEMSTCMHQDQRMPAVMPPHTVLEHDHISGTAAPVEFVPRDDGYYSVLPCRESFRRGNVFGRRGIRCPYMVAHCMRPVTLTSRSVPTAIPASLANHSTMHTTACHGSSKTCWTSTDWKRDVYPRIGKVVSA